MNSIVDDIKQSFIKGGVVTRLIYVNLFIFLVIRLITTFTLISGSDEVTGDTILRFFGMPASANQFALYFWTPITYMFTHFNFFHILFNLLTLYWFSPFFLRYHSTTDLLGLYVIGGLIGGLFYFTAFSFIPFYAKFAEGSILMGASASVMAIIFAAAITKPDLQINMLFFGNVSLKYLALIYFIIDLISITSLNAGGHIAHIGGAVTGYLFVLLYRQNINFIGAFGDLLSTPLKVWPFRRRKAKMSVAWRRPKTDQQFRSEKVQNQAEIDRILEKIKKSGYDSLTSNEKGLLFNESRK